MQIIKKISPVLKSDGFTVISYFFCLLMVTCMASEFLSKAALFQELLLAVLLVVLLVLHRDLLFKNKKVSIKLIGKAILWGLVAIILEIIVIAGFVLFTKTVLPSVNTTKVISIILRNPIFIVYTVIIAPLLEELVFRYSFFNLTVIIYSKLFNRNNQEQHSSVLRWVGLCTCNCIYVCRVTCG